MYTVPPVAKDHRHTTNTCECMNPKECKNVVFNSDLYLRFGSWIEVQVNVYSLLLNASPNTLMNTKVTGQRLRHT